MKSNNNNNKFRNNRNVGDFEYFVNNQIMASEVLCIDHNNNNLGLMPTNEALAIAEELSLDLVQITYSTKDRFPTCKILNYSKFKYENQKKKKAAIKSQRDSEIKTKEIKFRPSTAENDLRIKAKQVKDFLSQGYRVKVTITSKGRESTHKNLINDTFIRFMDLVSDAQILSEVDDDGRSMSVILGKSE